MPGAAPGADSRGREGATGPGSKELEWRWQTLLCPWGPVPAQSQSWVAAARPLLAPGGPLACTPAPHVVTGAWARVRGKSLPATRGCLQPACSCLAALYGFVGLEHHPCHAGKCRWVECPWGCAVGCHGHRGGSTGTELGWAPEHQSQGCLCHPCSVPLRWRVQSPTLRMQPRLKRPSMRCCPVTG